MGARQYANAFKRGTIPNSINIPVDTNQQTVKSLVQSVHRNKTLVIFCQSDRCLYDDIIASKLSGEGFSDIKIYQPGWLGWQVHVESIAK